MKIRIVRGAWDQLIAPYTYVTHGVGDVVDVSEDDARRLIRGGVAVDAAAKPVVSEPVKRARPVVEDKPKDVDASTTGAEKPLPPKPRRSASKTDWENYASEIGVVTQTADGADMSKSQIIVTVENYLRKHS